MTDSLDAWATKAERAVKARALSMLAAGQPLREVAQAVGVSHVTVWRWQKAAMENA